MKTLIKLVNGKEVTRKGGYANSENATNAGNSWKRNCSFHKNELNTRSFKIVDSEKKEGKKINTDWCPQLAIQDAIFEPNYKNLVC